MEVFSVVIFDSGKQDITINDAGKIIELIDKLKDDLAGDLGFDLDDEQAVDRFIDTIADDLKCQLLECLEERE